MTFRFENTQGKEMSKTTPPECSEQDNAHSRQSFATEICRV